MSFMKELLYTREINPCNFRRNLENNFRHEKRIKNKIKIVRE